MTAMNIGDAAAATGVSAKMIRHYEEIGLIGKAARTFSGYRTYSANDVHVLRFIRQARNLGFSIKQIGELLALWKDRRRPSSKVRALALAHIRDLEGRIAEMQSMKAVLANLAAHCHGDDRPDCPILDGLEGLSLPGLAAAPGRRPGGLSTPSSRSAAARRSPRPARR